MLDIAVNHHIGGGKDGQSANGAIWLNEERLSPLDFWQFWRNTEDADVERFLGLFTELPMDEVRQLGAVQGAEINDAKIILANHATALCHGEAAAKAAKATAQATFGGEGMSDGLPQVVIDPDEANQLSMIAAINLVGLAKSNGEARRLIRGGGARLNDHAITKEEAYLSQSDFVDGKAKISAGKKRHALIVIR